MRTSPLKGHTVTIFRAYLLLSGSTCCPRLHYYVRFSLNESALSTRKRTILSVSAKKKKKNNFQCLAGPPTPWATSPMSIYVCED